MGYQILDAPQGTLGYKQGMGEQMLGLGGSIMSGLTKGMKDNIFRKAIENSSLEPSFEMDKEGNWTVKYAPKKEESVADQKWKLGMVASGMSPASSIFGEKAMKESSPFMLGESEGGGVGTPEGATAKDGHLEEAGPGEKMGANSFDSVVRESLKKKIAENPALQSMLDMKPEKTVETKIEEGIQTQEAKEGVKEKAKQEETVNIVNMMIKSKADIADIQKIVGLRGFNIEEEPFKPLLDNYTANKGFRWPWAQNKPVATAPKLGEGLI